MKLFSVLAVSTLALSALTLSAQDTAYQALNVVGKAKGQPFLDNLLNAEGLNGGSQPRSWRLIFEDSGSRAGFREIEVRGGEIVSQRAPLKSPYTTSSRVNLDRLQLDSDGAFTVAEREAVRQRIGFATANYLLQADEPSGAPIWRVQLIDTSGSIVQTLRIAADNGTVIGGRTTRETSPGPGSDYVEDAPLSTGGGEVNPADLPESPEDTTELKINRGFRQAGRGIKNGFKHIGGSLQEIFTGRRTIDKDLPDE